MRLPRTTLRHTTRPRLAAAALVLAGIPLAIGTTAHATIVTTVGLGTSGGYSVLAGETVTNTGSSTFAHSVGLSPGSSITGFPPGAVTPPAIITNAAGAAQLALTNGYLDAAGRSVDATVTADLGGLTLQGGVYAASGKGALGLTGTLVLDANGDPDTVFIFQTDSSLTTASGSSVSLINGAQQCNVFWQVGSSAVLGSGSTMVGSVLALTSVSLASGVTVHGRTLARNGSVTLIADTFTDLTCARGTGDTTVSGDIPRTGAASSSIIWIAVFTLVVGVAATSVALRRRRVE